jgi:hypothetical protein
MAGSWGASVKNEVPAQEFSPFKTIEWTFTADASDGSVPNLEIPAADLYWMAGKSFYMVETIPGGTGPTTGAAVTLEDSSGDIFEGAVTLHETDRKRVRPMVNGKEDVWPYDGRALTLKVANNLVNSATATIRLFMYR